ncbi:MAG: OsmC family protein [Bacillota bacterium]|nr:OsmC family protein [Bacillota bacterium]MDW7683925.1 OsmC family protein [Bacillota bacterium]
MQPVHLKWHDGMFLEADAPSGYTVTLDGSAKAGGQGRGFLPSELLLTALGGCTSMDILSLLAKFHASPVSFDVELSGTRKEVRPKSFASITAVYRINGEIDPQQALKAVQSSFEKYSVVANSLNAELHYRVVVNGREIPREK